MDATVVWSTILVMYDIVPMIVVDGISTVTTQITLTLKQLTCLNTYIN